MRVPTRQGGWGYSAAVVRPLRPIRQRSQIRGTRITAVRTPEQYPAEPRGAGTRIELSGVTRSYGLTVGQGTQIDSECLLDKRGGAWLGIE